MKKITKIKLMYKNYSPYIVLGVSIAGMVGTVYLTYKKGTQIKMDQAQGDYDRQLLQEEKDDGKYDGNEMDYKKELAKTYLKEIKHIMPIASLYVISTVGIIYSTRKISNRIFAAKSALLISTAENTALLAAIEKEYGKEERDKYELESKLSVAEEYREMSKTYAKDIDELHQLNGRWFDMSTEYVRGDDAYNEAYIKQQIQNLNYKIMHDGYLVMNDVFDAFGFERTRYGAYLGWSDSDNFSIDITKMMEPDPYNEGEHIEQLYLYWKSPKDIYDSIQISILHG